MRPRAGLQILDLTLRRLLGAGAQGEVWSARRKDGTEVAVKILAPETPRDVLRAMREARLQRQVTHPHIVEVLDFQLVEGRPVLVSELVDGLSLRQLLRKGPVAAPLLDALAHQLFDGVEAAHLQGQVHRDLKPANVLLSATETGYHARITDFGIAMESAPFALGDDLTGRGLRMGTAGFMAPEQHQANELVDERADIFGLGALLYWMATGQRAFSGSSTEEVVERSCKGQFTPVNLLAPDLPRRWAQAIQWALEPNPRRRPSRVRDLWLAWDGVQPVPEWVSQPPKAPDMELTGSDLPTQVPPKAPQRLPRSFGRKQDLSELLDQLRNQRVTTLRGAPGIGKTHLALRAAVRWAREGAREAVVCYLTEARDEEGLWIALSAGLDLPFSRRNPLAPVGRALASRGRALVVLDNAEQAAGALAKLLPSLLTHAPRATFLVTSRRAIGLTQERVVDVGPLDPDDARAMFLERARRRHAGLALDATANPELDALLTQLDGNPLALELAAARARASHRSGLLDALRAAHDEPPMQVALRWSWELLTDWEKHVLGCAAVFRGGLFASALEAVADLEPWPEAPDAQQILHKLVDHSLVALRPVHELGDRIVPYASVQRFAEDAMRANERERAARAHLAWAASLAGPRGLAVRKGPTGEVATRLLLAETDNLTHALDNAIRLGMRREAVHCAQGLREASARLGPSKGVTERVRAAVEMGGYTDGEHARIQLVLGHFLREARDFEAADAAFDRAMARAKRAKDPLIQAEVLLRMGIAAHQRGQLLHAETRFDHALERMPTDAPPWRVARVHRQLAAIRVHLGAHDEAERSLLTALRLLVNSGCVTDLSYVHGHLGGLCAHQGKPGEAVTHERLALQYCRRLGDAVQECRVLTNLGVLHRQQRALQTARETLEHAVRRAARIGAGGHEALALTNLGEVLYQMQQTEDAADALSRAVELGDVTIPTVGALARAALAEVRIAQGRYAVAERLLDEAEPRLRDAHRQGYAAVQLARAACAKAQGDARGTRAWVQQAELAYGGPLDGNPTLSERAAELLGS